MGRGSDDAAGRREVRPRSAIPALDELVEFRWDQACYEVAATIAERWPQLKADAGFYVHPEHGVGDHGWNLAPDGTIVDMTATQHDYSGPEDEPEDEDGEFPVPEHPEIITRDSPYYERYVSWVHQPDAAQRLAHARGEHYDGPDAHEACPVCNA